MTREATAPAGSVCWRCGAGSDGAPLSGCTEKRGAGPPWLHDWKVPGRDHPWIGYTDAELAEHVEYLVMKALGSTATATAFRELDSIAGRYAVALYDEKAAKRGRLLRWAIAELRWRLRQKGD